LALLWCYDGAMRSVTALDVRRRFGQIIDEAAAGERIVIERAGQPIAAIVPLSDLALVDPERRKAERLAAIDNVVRMARRLRIDPDFDAAAVIRKQRLEREEQIARNVRRGTL
jgi:prevent-host-death family protein